MSETLKIVIPMAGFGTRLRPHTWSKPKPLISLAGKTVLAYVLEMFKTLPDPDNVELVFIVGYLGQHFKPYMEKNYPQLKVHYVEQPEMRGQSHAIYLARQHLSGPMLMVFADTLIDTNLAILADREVEAVAWVKPVPDPRRFGVAEVGPDGWVTRLVEKPKSLENNLVIVGFYYFRQAEALIAAIEEQMRRGVELKGEYFLADAVNIMIENGLKMRTQAVDTWLDAGVPATVLETNRHLLDHGRDNSAQAAQRPGVAVVPPVFIHPQAEVRGAVIGPHVSIGAGCTVENSVVRNAILEEGASLHDALLEDSLIGENVRIQGRFSSLNVGDSSAITL
jgi:glucose-1-phosphate thymidylyltransferase